MRERRSVTPGISTLIAHITDTRITAPGTLLMGIVDTASALERAVASLNRLGPSPDITVLTGDLADSASFAEIIRGHRQVERILCGHLHRPSRFAGTVAGTAPSTAHQIVLDLLSEARLSFAFESPGHQLHYWREGTGLVTNTAAIGDWPGPYFYSKKPATD